jgi:pimeloyl-ACP methyl ester carboxylesterase
VLIDNRGIGQSTGGTERLTIPDLAEDALAVADALGLSRFHLLGHSMGGVIAQRVALAARARVRSAVLQCTLTGGKDLYRPGAALLWWGLRTVVGTRAQRRLAFARLVTPAARIAERGAETCIAELEEVFGRRLDELPPVTDRQLQALRGHDERQRLAELRGLPCLVQSAALDPIARPVFGRTLAEGIGTAEYECWEGASHALPIHQADQVNERLLAFFRKVDAGESQA